VNYSLGIEESDRQFLVHSRGTHGDGNRFSNEDALSPEAENDLKRIFHRQFIARLRRGFGRCVSTNLKAFNPRGLMLRETGHFAR
jgi:hypothetical protein